MRDANYAEIQRIVLGFLRELGNDRTDYETWGEILDALRTATARYASDADARATEKAEAAYREKNRALDAKMQATEREKAAYARSKRLFDVRFGQLAEMPVQFQAWARSTEAITGVKDGQVLRKTIYELWTEHIAHIRQGIPGTEKMARIIEWADKGLRDGNGGLGS